MAARTQLPTANRAARESPGRADRPRRARTAAWRKTKAGEWVACGPVETIIAGRPVIIAKRNGDATVHIVAWVGRPFVTPAGDMVYGRVGPPVGTDRAPRIPGPYSSNEDMDDYNEALGRLVTASVTPDILYYAARDGGAHGRPRWGDGVRQEAVTFHDGEGLGIAVVTVDGDRSHGACIARIIDMDADGTVTDWHVSHGLSGEESIEAHLAVREAMT